MSGCQGVWDWLLVLLIRDSGKNGFEDSNPFWVYSFHLYTSFVWVPVFGFLPNQDRRLLLCFHPSVCSCWPSWLWLWRGKLRCLSVQVFQIKLIILQQREVPIKLWNRLWNNRRSKSVKWVGGCPPMAPCCSEFGYCRPLVRPHVTS